jgi:hypothetical protein
MAEGFCCCAVAERGESGGDSAAGEEVERGDIGGTALAACEATTAALLEATVVEPMLTLRVRGETGRSPRGEGPAVENALKTLFLDTERDTDDVLEPFDEATRATSGEATIGSGETAEGGAASGSAFLDFLSLLDSPFLSFFEEGF